MTKQDIKQGNGFLHHCNTQVIATAIMATCPPPEKCKKMQRQQNDRKSGKQSRDNGRQGGCIPTVLCFLFYLHFVVLLFLLGILLHFQKISLLVYCNCTSFDEPYKQVSILIKHLSYNWREPYTCFHLSFFQACRVRQALSVVRTLIHSSSVLPSVPSSKIMTTYLHTTHWNNCWCSYFLRYAASIFTKMSTSEQCLPAKITENITVKHSAIIKSRVEPPAVCQYQAQAKTNAH